MDEDDDDQCVYFLQKLRRKQKRMYVYLSAICLKEEKKWNEARGKASMCLLPWRKSIYM